jgi:hypothetical protein
VVNGYDDTDVVYLHQGFRTSGILANDVRLTPFGFLPAGSKVTPQDNDIGMPLTVLPGEATIGWVNLYGGPGNDLSDPIYIHAGLIGPGTLTATNDVRLTEVAGKWPGSKVGNLDPDLPDVFAIPPPGSPNPITTTSPPPLSGVINPPINQPSVRYVDVNGNNQYDYPDDVYLITKVPYPPAVTANDVRLSGP